MLGCWGWRKRNKSWWFEKGDGVGGVGVMVNLEQ